MTWSAPARPSRKRNWAYAVRRTSRRVIRPPAKNGREKAVADEVAMIVLSRSKKAAVLAMCSPSRLTVEGSGWRPHESGPTASSPAPTGPGRGVGVRRAACRQSTDGGAMAREVTVVGAAGGVGASTLAELLARWHGVDVLSTDRHDTTVDGEALAAVWAGLLASGRTVVADLPGSALVTGAIGAHPALAGGVLLLTGQDVLGVAGAVVVRGALGGGARLVLRRRPHARVAPSEAVRLLDLPLAGMLPGDRRVAEATDRGFGPAVTGWSALGRSVRRLARGLDHG